MPKIQFTSLDHRRHRGTLRRLSLRPKNSIDLASNDYLGLTHQKALTKNIDLDAYLTGSTGSRLLTGNQPITEEMEEQIAHFHRAPTSLIFNSGYCANLGLISAICDRHTTVVYDQNIHASVKDGVKLAGCRSYPFRHNDSEHLRQRLKKIAQPGVLVVVEALYSMDGDLVPLDEIVTIVKSFEAKLIVDEAHSVGVIGPAGRGLVSDLQLEDEVYARVVTFGKALGCMGAAVLGDKRLIEQLINFANAFIYTTALPPLNIAFIQAAYEILPEVDKARQDLREAIEMFRRCAVEAGFGERLSKANTHIQCFFGSKEELQRWSIAINENGIDCRVIRSPTVRRGSERLRVIIHAFNRMSDFRTFWHVIKEASL